MYINDVIRQVKRCYPSEYDETEMYIWCNEVSSMLAVEDRNVFREAYISTDNEGSALLPEGVTIENIESAVYGGKPLKKQNFACRGRRFVSGAPGRGIIKLVYIEPYRPIRLIRYRGEAEINSEENYIRTGACEFLQGDTLNIGVLTNGGAASVELNNIPLMAVDYDTSNANGYILRTAEGALSSADAGTRECVITRVITEETVCSAPYDSM